MSLNTPIVLITVRNRATGDLVQTREDWFDEARHERLVEEIKNFEGEMRTRIDAHYDTLSAGVDKLAAAIIGPPCSCGCGGNASPGRRFISGHNRKRKK